MRIAKKFLFTLLAAGALSAAGAQQAYLSDPNYGATPEEREETARAAAFFKDAFDQKDYPRAVQLMNGLIDRHPLATQNTFKRGVMMYQARTKAATSIAQRNSMIDSLMVVYDKWNESFGSMDSALRAEILRMKAGDYLAFKPADSENVHRFFSEAIVASEGKNIELLKSYFATLTSDYEADLVDTDAYIAEYERVSGLMKNAGEAASEDVNWLDALFSSTDAASCEILEKLYAPQYEAAPNDVELMKKILGAMTRAKCQSDFMLAVAENLYKVEKSPETGLYLATIFEGRQDYEKSLYYWEESIANEPDPTKKADYLMRAATSALSAENYRQAVAFARQALEIDSENGLAYLVIGQAYGYSNGCSDDFTRRAAYWLVVDVLQRARGLLAGDSAQVEFLNKQIAHYTTLFPPKDAIFFHELQPGQSYTVNCGLISGSTTVREGR